MEAVEKRMEMEEKESFVCSTQILLQSLRKQIPQSFTKCAKELVPATK